MVWAEILRVILRISSPVGQQTLTALRRETESEVYKDIYVVYATQGVTFGSLLVPARRPRYLLLEGLCHRVLLSGVAAQAHEREEAVRL